MSGPVLFISTSLLVESWRALRDGAREGVESTVRWAGPACLRRGDVHVVTTVVNPIQRVSRGSFEIPHDGTRAMGEALSSHGLMNFAQLHTHPATWVGHSPWDNARAYSSRDHALSIVWPNYGAQLPALGDWGVHERQAGEWRSLSPTVAAQRIHIIPDILKLRGPLNIVDDFEDNDVNIF